MGQIEARSRGMPLLVPKIVASTLGASGAGATPAVPAKL
jgi:hypothetical protein